MNAGVCLDAVFRRFPVDGIVEDIEPLLDRIVAEGLMVRTGSQLRLSHEGRLVCDGIGSELLALLA
jgi:coproporphyrinogen III oxidase-like Fe-S oxidoreductase